MAQYRTATGIVVATVPERTHRPIEIAYDRSALLLSLDEASILACGLADAVAAVREVNPGTDKPG